MFTQSSGPLSFYMCSRLAPRTLQRVQRCVPFNPNSTRLYSRVTPTSTTSPEPYSFGLCITVWPLSTRRASSTQLRLYKLRWTNSRALKKLRERAERFASVEQSSLLNESKQRSRRSTERIDQPANEREWQTPRGEEREASLKPRLSPMPQVSPA